MSVAKSLFATLACLLMFHGPDGTVFRIESAYIVAVRAVTSNISEHLAHGTRTVLYVDAQKFGVIETAEQAEAMIKGCGQ